VHGREHQYRVVDRVVREDHDGLAHRQLQVEQALRHRAHGVAQREVVELAPAFAAVVVAFRESQRIRRFTCPALQPFADAARIGLERHR
jgi:hypothetical protein